MAYTFDRFILTIQKIIKLINPLYKINKKSSE